MVKYQIKTAPKEIFSLECWSVGALGSSSL
jgi:hypothetical protein